MENLTGGTPPVRYLPCVVPCKLYFSPIITLAYNAVIGGVVGIAGSLYYLFVIRKLVMDNRAAFDELEMNCRTVKDKSEL
jgi:hypothetical protein